MQKLSLAALIALSAIAPLQAAPAWRGYAGNGQHTAPAPVKGNPLKSHLWQMPIDLDPQLSGGELLIHYGSPMITESNTVIVPVKTGAFDGFRIEARSGVTGKKIWRVDSDFTLAPHDWVPSFPAHLTAQNRLYYAGAGGTVYWRDTPDLKKGAGGQIAFYGNGKYQADKGDYDAKVKITTPITADEAGNIYFGFTVLGDTKAKLASGIARIAANGKGNWVAASAAAQDSAIREVAMNCAPAISNDGTTVYIAVSDGESGYVLGLDSATLATKYKVRPIDPQTNAFATVFDDSSAAPTVGPDGDVFFGVLEGGNQGHNGRGWLMHYSADLATTKTPGSFGWDDTVSIVPTAAVPSYTGSSPYLLMSKYNNYYGAGGDGHNEIAILDPDQTQTDRFSSVTVLKEIMTKENPVQVPGAPAGVVYEWCINAAVVDAKGKAVIANAEDGHTYRWDLAKDKLTSIYLNPPLPEAYTPTVIGPDGTTYAINNSTLYALGK